ncbi:MAG: hypothetical protein COU28_03025 [Candidatus Magasanikbacteria bacterium CG10_big_fil_rev_8_21_14_0_10_36_16]|uniref:Uncharacterized protein n=1 Tax=Candidatus Magasanikbacteria bacterium CG10_big_fil_rev_8_21_14_0_10_36_16 TaxID=1974645 RepID=A0A2H0TY63_9BACT|nr:MAG: hypothetical protein COU28_03025 [Candidatus Magasanikbacteria bacterium CG10_big_fil_rev_8_21_14_0_10_36_16]
MGRYYYGAKNEADGLKKITTYKLKEWGYFDGRWAGTITWTSSWSDSKSSVSIQVQTGDYEEYLRIWYTQTDYSTDKKTDFDYKIPLVTTTCNLGGKRYWFRCPWYANGVYCGRRVGVLYLGGQRFACRYCYDLSYACKNENRRSSFSPFGKMLDLEEKIAKLEDGITTEYYNGRPTRKYKKLIELKRRYYGFDMDSVLQNMEKMLGR